MLSVLVINDRFAMSCENKYFCIHVHRSLRSFEMVCIEKVRIDKVKGKKEASN